MACLSILFALTLKQKLVYRRRHETGKILAVFAQLRYERRGNSIVIGTETHRFEVRCNELVDGGYVFLIVVVHAVAQPSDGVAYVVFDAKIADNTVVDAHSAIGKTVVFECAGYGSLHELGRIAPALFGVDGNDDIQPVE